MCSSWTSWLDFNLVLAVADHVNVCSVQEQHMDWHTGNYAIYLLSRLSQLGNCDYTVLEKNGGKKVTGMRGKRKKFLDKWDWCRVWETCSYRRCGWFLGVLSPRKAQGCLFSIQDFRRCRLVLLSRHSIFPSFWSLPLNCSHLPVWSNSATLIFFPFHCHLSIPWLKKQNWNY